jgi:hypothetical protein
MSDFSVATLLLFVGAHPVRDAFGSLHDAFGSLHDAFGSL